MSDETVTVTLSKLELHDLLVGINCMAGIKDISHPRYDWLSYNWTHVKPLRKKIKALYDTLPREIGNELGKVDIIKDWTDGA